MTTTESTIPNPTRVAGPLEVVLVEDNPVDAKLYRARLEKMESPRVHVTETKSLAETLEIVRRAPPHIVLLDLNLPDCNGIETLKRLLAVVGDVPIVVLTGEEDEDIALRSLKAGAQEYVRKAEFEPRLIGRVIRFALERRASEVERKKMLLQLDNSQRLESLGQLAAGVAHEINTPIQFIGDNTSFARDSVCGLLRLAGLVRSSATDDLAPAAALDLVKYLQSQIEDLDIDYIADELPKALEQTLEGVAHVANIVKAMKEFAHPGTRDPIRTDLLHLLETSITITRNTWKYVADVQRDFGPDPILIECYPAELNQTFLNMIVNATHAIEDAQSRGSNSLRGSITIQARQRANQVEIRVSDNGCGIPRSAISRIFDPFFTTKEVGRGTGQGLAVAYNAVVKHHGGTIDVESVEGSGTTFIIRLPMDIGRAGEGSRTGQPRGLLNRIES